MTCACGFPRTLPCRCALCWGALLGCVPGEPADDGEVMDPTSEEIVAIERVMEGAR